MAYATVHGARIHYEVEGEGTPVVLVMGFGMPGSAWRNQVPLLAPNHRVLSFDNRGAGRSESEPGAWTMRILSDDVVGLMDHVGFERAHLVGVSMGGMISQELALRARPRVRSLTLIATHAGGLRAVFPPKGGLRLFLDAQRADGEARLESLERLLFPHEFLEATDRAKLRDALATDLSTPAPAAMRWSQLAAVLRHRTSRRLEGLAGVPTLVIRPGQDRLIDPRESERLAAAIPGARLLRYEEAGHGVIRQCAERLARDLLAHFAEADAHA